MTVAGVGSSVLGAAALGRNVANLFGFDVISIIAGYGMADLPLEALGGWFNLVNVLRALANWSPLGRTAKASEVTRPLLSAMPGVVDCKPEDWRHSRHWWPGASG